MCFHFITLATIVTMICQSRAKSVGAILEIMTSIHIHYIVYCHQNYSCILETIAHRHCNNNIIDIAQEVILHM